MHNELLQHAFDFGASEATTLAKNAASGEIDIPRDIM